METKSNAKLKALFIIPSITGIILFMIPVKNADGDWTVVVKILADIISGYIGGLLPPLRVLVPSSRVPPVGGPLRGLPAAAVRADPHRFRGDVGHRTGKTQIHYE